MKKRSRLAVLVLLLLGLLANPYAIALIRRHSYDLTHSNHEVREQKVIRKILDRFEKFPFSKLAL